MGKNNLKIAVITLMRKGSKRFPNKCMANFIDKPLYRWTVDIALQSGFPYYLAHDYNTKLIKDENAIELKRKAEYAGDQHKTCEEIKSFNIDADIYIFLQATNPIREFALLNIWINQFLDSNCDAGFSAKIYKNKYAYNDQVKELNFDFSFRTDNGCIRDWVCIETGNFYIFRKNMLEKQHILCTNNKIIFDDPHLIDIDTKEDLIYAEKYYNENLT